MNSVPKVVYHIKPANKFLWAVKSFINLITRKDRLTYGDGLKRFYTLSCGAATFNDRDIIAITEKSERMGLIPNNLYLFMMSSIMTNCKFYGEELAKLINARIVDISNGTVTNPDATLKYSPIAARRNYYLPPSTLIHRIQKAIDTDTFTNRMSKVIPVPSFNEVAVDAMSLLSRLQITEGHIFPNSSSFGAMSSVIQNLLYILHSEAEYPIEDRDYQFRARSVLTLLWIFAKLLYGDLTIMPQREDINEIDIGRKLTISDGTLAAIPFPTKETLSIFAETGTSGVSMKGLMYLSAVTNASIYRSIAI